MREDNVDKNVINAYYGGQVIVANDNAAVYAVQNNGNEYNDTSWKYTSLNVNENMIENRSEEIECIRKRFENGNYLFLYGEHGIGKTIMAQSFAIKHFKKKTIFVEYKNSFKETIISVVKYFFNKETIEAQKDNKYEAIINELRENQETTKEWLIIIDNFNSYVDHQNKENNQFIDEFWGNDFKEFIATGINVLITTTIKESFSDYGMGG